MKKTILLGAKTLLLLSLCLQSTNAFSQRTVKLKPGAAYGEDVELQTSFGCTMSGSSAPAETLNFGTAVEMNYAEWTYSALGCGNGTDRTLIRFKGLDTITGISGGVISAKLNLFGVATSGNWGTSSFSGSPYYTTNPGWVQRVTGSWTELGVTWNTQPSSTTTNRKAIDTSTARFGWNTSIDVTDLVNDIITSGANNGFLLELQSEVKYRRVTFASSDNEDSTIWPELVIVYGDPCGGTVAQFKDTSTSCYTFNFTDQSVAKDSGIVTRHWSFGDGATSTSTNPSHTYADYGTYNVTLSISDSAGCMDTFTKAITIDYTHFANAGRDTGICLQNGITPVFFLIGNTGAASYAWTPIAGVHHPTLSSTYVDVKAPTVYYLSEVNNFGCKDIDSVFINAYPTPNVKAVPKDTLVMCVGSYVQLGVSGANSYQWIPSVGLDSANIATPKLKATQAAQYVVKGTDNKGCIGYDTLNVTIGPSVVVDAQPKNAYGCFNDKIQLSATGAVSYVWTPAQGLNADSIANPMATISKTETYYVTGISAAGCEGYDSVMINLYPNPLVHAYSADNHIRCRGASVQLNATGASQYEWQPATYCDNNKNSSTIVTPTNTTVFTVTGTSSNGCIGTDTISVIFDGQSVAFVPNAFSPNGDGRNDNFGVVDNCNFHFYSMLIFDRWGEQIFSSFNQNDKWDGTYKGAKCDVGVYFYMVRGQNLENKEIVKSGDVTLLR